MEWIAIFEINLLLQQTGLYKMYMLPPLTHFRPFVNLKPRLHAELISGKIGAFFHMLHLWNEFSKSHFSISYTGYRYLNNSSYQFEVEKLVYIRRFFRKVLIYRPEGN